MNITYKNLLEEGLIKANEELAKAYFKAVIDRNSEDFKYMEKWNDTYRDIQNLIANCPVNIPFLYDEFGSLQELHINGINDDTKNVLELILEKGADSVMEIQRRGYEERERKNKKKRIYEGMRRIDSLEYQEFMKKLENKDDERFNLPKKEIDEAILDEWLKGIEND